jgi:hypothetical protein
MERGGGEVYPLNPDLLRAGWYFCLNNIIFIFLTDLIGILTFYFILKRDK